MAEKRQIREVQRVGFGLAQFIINIQNEMMGRPTSVEKMEEPITGELIASLALANFIAEVQEDESRRMASNRKEFGEGSKLVVLLLGRDRPAPG